MTKISLLVLVITTGGIGCSNVHAHSKYDLNRTGGGVLLVLGALGALQSGFEFIATWISVRGLAEYEPFLDDIRYVSPTFLAHISVGLVDGDPHTGAGFCTLLNGIVRLSLAKKGWDILWQEQKNTQEDAKE